MKNSRRVIAMFLATILAVTGMGVAEKKVEAAPSTKTASQAYVEAMGHGWNLGNSFDGFDADLTETDTGEEAWGNPIVSRELIHAVKEKGYDSIRIPMTVHRRYTINADAGADDYKYVINADWLARYKEVVDWAVDEGMYVMVDIHHDSWIWLKQWNGDTSAEEYRMYTDFWKQLANYFKDEPAQVCFETINEPDFLDSEGVTAQQKLDMVNRAAYDIIRGIPENANRMIVMPTMLTNYEKSESLYQLIETLHDENIIATVHYYSEWVYSANLGKTGFDETLWDDYTPRDAADKMMNTIKTQFIDNGIGVIIGEYGLLGYDTSEGCLQAGEEMKYYEYMNELARQNGVCLVFWDNGSGINRTDFTWKKPLVGKLLEASMSQRFSYTTGLDTLYFKETVTEDVTIPLTLNGNTFIGIEGLNEGSDYTYDVANAVLTLKKDFINSRFEGTSGFGTIAELVLKFSQGADWHQYLVKCAVPVIGKAEGTKEGIDIPVNFQGSRVRRIMTYEVSGKVGPNSSWWSYLKYDDAFHVDEQKGTISFTSALFNDSSVTDGLMKAKVEFYDGQTADIWMKIDGNTVTSSPEFAQNTEEMGASEVICLYAGETQIPSQYLYMPEGASVYGTYTNDDTMVQLDGWPATMTFDTKAHENFTEAGIKICYMDVEKYIDFSLGIKDAPVVEGLEIKAGGQKNVKISNLSSDAKLSYCITDQTIAKVDENGKVTGQKEGTTKISVTVTQYNRTDNFEGTITVKGTTGENNSGNNQNPADNQEENNNQQSQSDNRNGNNGSQVVIYPVKKTENLNWNAADGKDMVITVDVDFEKFTTLMVDGNIVDTSNYKAEKGSTIITIKSDYLKTLTAGNHIIRINFTDGYAEVTATITQNETTQQAGATAKTGDNTQMAGTIFLGMAAVIVLLDQRKRHCVRK